MTATTFLVTGRGWGHGVGMSQYGALGYAQNGWTYDQILAHYYPAPSSARRRSTRVRVLVAEAKGSVTVRSSAPVRVRDVFGKTLSAAGREAGARAEAARGGQREADRAPRAVLVLPRHGAARLDQPYRGQIAVS